MDRRAITGHVQKFAKNVHWGIAAALPLEARRRYLCTVGTGKIADLRNPVTFNEKVNWRILHDRRPRIVQACDKMAMKDMARAVLPETDLKIPRTIWSGTDLNDAPDLAEVGPWVLKPNHSSGQVLFGPPVPANVRSATRTWVADNKPATRLGEWGYGQARALLLLEERIPTPDGLPPSDYKFLVFDGVPRYIQVNGNRHGDPQISFHDTTWNNLGVTRRAWGAGDPPRPAGLERMLDIAAALGAGWDFIRIDLYEVGSDIWFGEYSPYPWGGNSNYNPRSFDVELGRHWQLPSLADVAAP